MIPIYTFTTWVGTRMTGTDFMAGDLNFSDLTFSNVVGELKHLLVPFIVGSFSVAIAAALISYVIVYLLMRRLADGRGK
jgi:uncharacterized protein (DUF2062 family)